VTLRGLSVTAGTAPLDVVVGAGEGIPTYPTGQPGHYEAQLLPGRSHPQTAGEILRAGDENRTRVLSLGS